MGEVFGSDICALGGEGYYSELSDSEAQKVDEVYNVAHKIADACKCFKGGIFTDWDEDVVKSSLESVPSGSEDDLKDLLYCYMKGAPDSMFNKLKPNYNPVDALIRTLTPKTQYFDGNEFWKIIKIRNGPQGNTQINTIAYDLYARELHKGFIKLVKIILSMNL